MFHLSGQQLDVGRIKDCELYKCEIFLIFFKAEQVNISLEIYFFHENLVIYQKKFRLLVVRFRVLLITTVKISAANVHVSPRFD